MLPISFYGTEEVPKQAAIKDCVNVTSEWKLISCNSSLLECSTAVQEVVGSNHGRDMSVSGALMQDEEHSIGGTRIKLSMPVDTRKVFLGSSH
jgi:hypothetical protein